MTVGQTLTETLREIFDLRDNKVTFSKMLASGEIESIYIEHIKEDGSLERLWKDLDDELDSARRDSPQPPSAKTTIHKYKVKSLRGAQELIIKVTIEKRFGVRVWIAKMLVAAAGKVLGNGAKLVEVGGG